MAVERFYISRIVGTGVPDVDEFRPAVAVPGVDFNVVYPPLKNPTNPPPPPNSAADYFVKPYCLVLVKTANHAKLIDKQPSEPEAKGFPFPELPLDQLSILQSNFAKNMLAVALTKAGISTNVPAAIEKIESAGSIRRILRDVGIHISGNPNWDERAFGIETG